jgi:hypothetical protein
MLSKNHTKRITIDKVLDHDWFEKYRKLNNRKGNAASAFASYSLTEPDSPHLAREIDDVKARLKLK